MELAFLGTGSGYPTPCRGASAIALRYQGEVWMIDCGEGTQTQIMKLKSVKPGNITKIFITHLHGDHTFGLPGLLCTMSQAFNPIDYEDLNTRESKFKLPTIEIYGPLGLRRFIREALHLSRSITSFTYVVHELIALKQQYDGNKSQELDWNIWNPDHLAMGKPHPCELDSGRAIFHDPAQNHWLVCQTKNFTISAGQLKHRIPSFGYVFQETTKPGKLNTEKLANIGVPKGPMFGRIKNGEKVTLENGHVIDPGDFIGPAQQGRKVAILQDSCDSWSMRDSCSNCDVLIHEATNENSHQEKCVSNGHSTPDMAATFATAVNAEILVLTHCSQRYKDPHLHDVKEGDVTSDLLKSEAQASFNGQVVMAYDGLIIDVKRQLHVT